MENQIVTEIKENWGKACSKFYLFVLRSDPPVYLDSDIYKLKSDLTFALSLMENKDARMKLAVGVFWDNFTSAKRNSPSFKEAKTSILDGFSLSGFRGLMYIKLIAERNPDVLKLLHSTLENYKI